MRRTEANNPLLALVHRAVTKAVGQAGDAVQFPDQLAEAGLKPWRVKQVYGAMARARAARAI